MDTMLKNNLTTQQACQVKINNLWTLTVPVKNIPATVCVHLIKYLHFVPYFC